MEPARAPATQTSYRLCVGTGQVRVKHAESELALSDEGIAYELEGRGGLRSFTDLRGVRLQAVNGGPRAPWEALAELTFARGLPLFVYSSGSWGTDDPERDAVFVAFLEDLHRRLLAGEHHQVVFRRGISESRHQVMIVVTILAAILFGGAGLLVLYIGLSGKAGFFEVLGPLIGLIGFGMWIWRSLERTAPGSYDPRQLPRDVFPE